MVQCHDLNLVGFGKWNQPQDPLSIAREDADQLIRFVEPDRQDYLAAMMHIDPIWAFNLPTQWLGIVDKAPNQRRQFR